MEAKLDNNSFEVIEAYALVDKTKDAYMFDDYGKEEWFNCICFLLQEGFDGAGAEAIVRSKHMRWSSDARDIQTGDEFIRYYHKYKERDGYSEILVHSEDGS